MYGIGFTITLSMLGAPFSYGHIFQLLYFLSYLVKKNISIEYHTATKQKLIFIHFVLRCWKLVCLVSLCSVLDCPLYWSNPCNKSKIISDTAHKIQIAINVQELIFYIITPLWIVFLGTPHRYCTHIQNQI